jgi:predicted nucleic acid-binding protein
MAEAFSFPLPVFFDSDVMIAGSVSTHGASFALLQLAELGLIKGTISERFWKNAERIWLKNCRMPLFLLSKLSSDA